MILLFFLSGFSALVYEMLWLRDFGFLLGNSTYTLSTVLAAYMLGLALGSHYGGKLAARSSSPLRDYALAELGVALSAALLYWAFHSGLKDLGSIGATLPRFALAFALLLPPTFCMGLTLPLLARHYGDVPLLYAVNTAGAALGCFAAGFYLLRLLGMWGSTLFALGLNTAICLAALFLARAGAGRGLARSPEPPSPPGNRRIEWLFFLSGFSCFAYEILYGRLLSYILGNRAFAHSTLISAFLVGISLGSFAAGRWLRRGVSELKLFAVLQLATGLFAALFVGFFPEIRSGMEGLEKALGLSTPWAYVMARFAEAFVLLLIPAFSFGAIFPAMIQALGPGNLGRAYAVNTLGCIAGSLLAGFALLPWLGAYKASFLLAAFSILLAWRLSRTGVLALAALALALGFSSVRYPWPRPGLKQVFAHEDASTLVSVHTGPLGYYMFGDDTPLSYPVGENTNIYQVQKMQAHLPLLLHPEPKRVLVVGLGFGISAGSFAVHPGVEKVDCVEIFPGCLLAAPLFSRYNLDVARRPNVEVSLGDGRYFLRHAPKPYDIIASNVSGPDLPGSASCYTRDFFALAKSKLAPGGLFLIHAYGQSRDIILRTLLDVFPEVHAYRAYSQSYFLLASDRPPAFDPKRIDAFLAKAPLPYRRDTRTAGLRSAAQLREKLLFETAEARRNAAGQPLNTDDLPIVEYRLHDKNRDIFVGRY